MNRWIAFLTCVLLAGCASSGGVPESGHLECNDADVNRVAKNAAEVYDNLSKIRAEMDAMTSQLKRICASNGVSVAGETYDAVAQAVEQSGGALKGKIPVADLTSLTERYNRLPAMKSDLDRLIRSATDLIPSVTQLSAKFSGSGMMSMGLGSVTGNSPVSALNRAKGQLDYVANGEQVKQLVNGVSRFLSVIAAIL